MEGADGDNYIVFIASYIAQLSDAVFHAQCVLCVGVLGEVC